MGMSGLDKSPSGCLRKTPPGFVQPWPPLSLAAQQREINWERRTRKSDGPGPRTAFYHKEKVIIAIRFDQIWLWQTYIIEGCAVLEHQQDVVYKLLCGEIVESVALVEFPADHWQADGPLDDLVVVPGLEHIHRDEKAVAESAFIYMECWTLFSSLHVSVLLCPNGTKECYSG